MISCSHIKMYPFYRLVSALSSNLFLAALIRHWLSNEIIFLRWFSIIHIEWAHTLVSILFLIFVIILLVLIVWQFVILTLAVANINNVRIRIHPDILTTWPWELKEFSSVFSNFFSDFDLELFKFLFNFVINVSLIV